MENSGRRLFSWALTGNSFGITARPRHRVKAKLLTKAPGNRAVLVERAP